MDTDTVDKIVIDLIDLTLPDVMEEKSSDGEFTYYNVEDWSFEDDWTEEEHWQSVLVHLAMIKYLRDKRENNESDELDRPEDSGNDPGGTDTAERTGGVERGCCGGS